MQESLFPKSDNDLNIEDAVVKDKHTPPPPAPPRATSPQNVTAATTLQQPNHADPSKDVPTAKKKSVSDKAVEPQKPGQPCKETSIDGNKPPSPPKPKSPRKDDHQLIKSTYF